VNRLDLADPGLYLSGVPYEYFHWLRDHEPVAWHEERDGSGYWVITRYDDVVAANRDWRRYSNARRGAMIEDPASEDELAVRRMIFVNQDPPTHTRTRKLVSPAFTPGRVRVLTGRIEAMCSHLVDRLVVGEVVDFARIGEELSFQMVASMFGVPESDWPTILDWTLRITNFQEPELNPALTSRAQLQGAALSYARDLIAEVRLHPEAHGGIVSDLVRSEIARDDGGPDRLSDDELATFFLVVVVGGVGTTAHTLSEAMRAMSENPMIFRPFQEAGDCPAAVVEELIRWAGPVMNFRRTATEDHELRGARIRAGDKVLLSFSSANRDDRQFEHPDAFDAGRTPNDHVGFGGGGPHFCIGAQLARLDLRLMLREIFRRVDRVELVGEPVRLRSNQFAGWLHVPLRVSAR
jgi:cholest-4-en-3-one 26-monooxygenase